MNLFTNPGDGSLRRLTCVAETVDEAPCRLAVIHGVAGGAQHEETPASFGLIAGFDQRVLLAELASGRQSEGPVSQKRCS